MNDLELSPKKFSKFKSIFDPWQRLCKKNKISRINACINFILNLSFVSKLIIGFKNSEEVKELSKIQGHKIDFYNKKIFKNSSKFKRPKFMEKHKVKKIKIHAFIQARQTSIRLQTRFF